MKVRLRLVRILVPALVVSFACIEVNSHASNARPQTQERTIKRRPQRNEPLDIAEVKLKGKKLELNKQFVSDDENWLNGLTVTIRNKSDKAILFAEIILQFPRPSGSQGPVVIDELSVGNRALLTNLPSKGKRAFELLPGDTIVVQAPLGEFDPVRQHLGEIGYSPNIVAVDLRIGHVIFEDDTMWYVGTRCRRDPNDPATWVNVELNETQINMTTTPAGTHSPSIINSGLILSDTPYVGPSLFLSESLMPSLLLGNCRALQTPTFEPCSNTPLGCKMPKDKLTNTAGGYFLGTADALCKKDDNSSCFFYRTTELANECTTCDPIDCPEGQTQSPPPDCTCKSISPIVVDVAGNGFDLTDVSDGVVFDFNGNGIPDNISWTATGSDDAWLVMDRNGNNSIDNGMELFGNLTLQPSPPANMQRNGFLALAEYDKPENGGNGDREIKRSDAVFFSLRLWQDVNHNGISEVAELHRLPELGLKSIDLDCRESKRRDQQGNWFRYRAKVKDVNDAQLGRWAWDVLLLGGESAQNPKNRQLLSFLFSRTD